MRIVGDRETFGPSAPRAVTVDGVVLRLAVRVRKYWAMTAGVEWRGAEGDADVDAWVVALSEIEAVDRTGEALGRADLDEQLGLSYFDGVRDVRLGWCDGRVVAWGTALCIPTPTQRRVLLAGAVVPGARGSGVGTALLTWQIERGREVAAAQGHDAPGWLELAASEGDGAREELFGEFGFTPLRYYFEMRRPLAGPPVEPDRDDLGDLRIEPFDFTHDEAVRVAHNEAFRDHFAATVLDAETWNTWVTGDHQFRADCSFIVFAGEEVAAYAINAVHPDDWPLLGFSEGWTHQLGVRRPWRGRGLARALLRATAQAFQVEGLDYAALDVDAENPTGARGLYESEGYRRDKTRVAWSLPVD